MRVHVVDPSAYTPPYDHALCRALAAAGADVELQTSRFAYGPVAVPDGYRRSETFYRAAARVRRPSLRRTLKLAEHVPDMLRYRHTASAADVVHFQWLPVQPLDAHLLPRRRPLVLTAHDVLPREPRPAQLAGQRRLFDRFDAIVVHSAHGRARLIDELAVDASRVHAIPHGPLAPWQGFPEQPLPPELLPDEGAPVVLFFGLLRPYKGLDVLLDAWREIAGAGEVEGAELWIVGMPRMDLEPLRVRVRALARVRWLTRFVSDAEIAALMRRATLIVLPYREIDQSGVAYAALAARLPMLLSDAGGFPELAAAGVARAVPAGNAPALAAALEEMLDDPQALAAMRARASALVEGEASWRKIAARTIALYESLIAG